MIRTLVVDDDFMVAEVHAGYLAKVPDFLVTGRAHTGTDALRLVEALRPDLVLLDVYLPDLSGLEVLRRLRAGAGPEVDVVVITAARDVETVRAAMRGGVEAYLIKPFSFPTFRERMEQYASRRRSLHSAGTADQEQVDRLYGFAGSTRATLPKGLSRKTFELVVGTLTGAGVALSAQDVSDQTGVSRVSVRRYLEHLEATGRADLELRYGTAGRPEHRYRWSGGARSG